MGLIKNFTQLAKTEERGKILSLVNAALDSIQPQNVIPGILRLAGDTLGIQTQSYELTKYRRLFLIGFGKGSAAFAKEIERIIGGKLAEGFVIDVEGEKLQKISFTKGTHPLPSQENYDFTIKLLQHFTEIRLREDDLVLVVVCGGGSAMLVAPDKIDLEKQIAVSKALLASGANIYDMNTVRKHLSRVKGGGLAKALYPATIATMVFSDVPGNDLSFIASGPTVRDETTIDDAWSLIEKFGIRDTVKLTKNDLSETPKEEEYFANVHNQVVMSNKTALQAMQKEAAKQGLSARIFSDTFQSDANVAGKTLIDEAKKGEVLLAGGETTVKVAGGGEGGRNQEVVLAALPALSEKTILVSFDSDGWDNSHLAGAVGDHLSRASANSLGLVVDEYLAQNNSLSFFEQVGDGIETGRLPANVSDLFIVYKYA